MITRSCSTLLCLILWSNALGTPAVWLAMKMAVPGTRVALFLALLAKISTGRAISLIRSRIR